MKFLSLLLIATPTAALACGPFFYPAPPTLDQYPERLPVKTLRELLKETKPSAADAATFDDLAHEVLAIGSKLGVGRRDEVLKRIDAALENNRRGEYRKRFANCLYDFRDLFQGESAPAEEISRYTEQRAKAMDWDDGFFDKPPSRASSEISNDKFDTVKRAWEDRLEETADRLAEGAEKASPALKPHWLVEAGAWQFKHARFEEAARLFQRVIDETPKHPRAEVALLMLARVRIEEWRAVKVNAGDGGGSEQEKQNKLEGANNALEAYVAAYPKGRFALDIPGWRAGLARESGDLSEALRQFLQQMDFVDHPEIVRRAVRECEACLSALDASEVSPDEQQNDIVFPLPLDEIAARPIAALAVVYHFLDSESRRGFDGFAELDSDSNIAEQVFPPVLKVRRTGNKLLPALAAAVARRRENYGGAVWRPKYLAILAWAASESGDQTQAIKVCDLAGPALEGCDDLLFARAVALQRAGESKPAIAGFRRLQGRFPKSPLSEETRFRIATALRDEHESGLAAVELMRIEKDQAFKLQHAAEGVAGTEPLPELHLDSEIGQLIDTLLQFAPLAELERGLTAPELEPELAARFRRMLRMRYLAREDFDAASRFVGPPVEKPTERYYTAHPEELAGEVLQSAFGTLSSLTKDAAKNSAPAARAEKLFALAEAWSSVRGYFTLPSVEDGNLFRDEFYTGWARRFRNASVTGFSAEGAADELELRDEFRHAFRYYLQAADSAPGTPLAARALWRANDGLRRMAELSPWSSVRAFQTDAAALSRKLYERLLRECPASEEAKRLSLWYSFPPEAELRWMPGDRQDYNVEVAIADAFEGRAGDTRESPEWKNYSDLKEPLARLAVAATNAGSWDAPKLLRELAAIRTDFTPRFVNSYGAWVINDLDDLTLFQEPGLTPSARAKYFAARLGKDAPELDDPELKPWSDYVAFIRAVREGHELMSVRMEKFLEKFPKSRKREAAMARRAIALVRETRVHTGVRNTDWPEAPKLGGYKAMDVRRDQPFEATRVFEALDAYDREFPHGRYAAEMKLWRGVASIEARDWKAAVNLLVVTLDDKTKPDLHLDASLALADVFMSLLEQPEVRPEIMAAIRGDAAARKRLYQFMRSETLGARLCCLEGYFHESFGLAGDP